MTAPLNNPQLPLGLALRDSARFDSYYPGDNREALASLQAAARGAGERQLFLAAPAGLGKTHLLQAACHAAGECGRRAGYLPLREVQDVAAMFDGLEQLDLVCLDDVDAMAGDSEAEQALFVLFNRLRDAGTTLLLTAAHRPAGCGFRLPDLVSRLGWGAGYVLSPLAEAQASAALQMRARARGLILPGETARYLMRRLPRDLPSLFERFDTLDSASLVEQRRLTIPFVKAVLNI